MGVQRPTPLLTFFREALADLTLPVTTG